MIKALKKRHKALLPAEEKVIDEPTLPCAPGTTELKGEFTDGQSSEEKNKKSPLERFFLSRAYALILCLLVMVGHLTALEFYFNIPFVILSAISLFTVKSIKPFIPTMLTFVYQITIEHVPGFPTWSNYYAEPERIVVLGVVVVILLTAILFYFFKNTLRCIKPSSSPLFYPLVLLSVAFMTNGLLSENWILSDLIFGFAESLVFFVLFYMIYYGIKEEDTKELLDYMSFLSLLISIILISQIAKVYLHYNDLIDRWGRVIKHKINVGWGGPNPLAFAIVIQLPFLIRGAIKLKRWGVYAFVTVLNLFAIFLTFSRNAFLFAAITTAILFLSACFFGKRKKFFTNLINCAGVFAFMFLFVFIEKLEPLLAGLKLVGLGDSGRNNIWNKAIEQFNESPLFGSGFFGLHVDELRDVAAFLPDMAHNTFLQLLMAMGIFGFFAYFVYRIHSFKPFITKPSFEKLILFFVIFITLGTSMLDNFIFYFHTAFPYIISLAIAFKMMDEENKVKAEKRMTKKEAKIAKRALKKSIASSTPVADTAEDEYQEASIELESSTVLN